MKTTRPILFLAALLLALSAAARAAESGGDSGGHRLQPGDVIQISLWTDEESVRDATVDGEGNITYSPVGSLSVKGLTLAEAAQRITEALVARHYRKPKVQVTLKATPSQRPAVYVLGAVQRPGPVDFVEGMRVMVAIAQAGGLTPNADAAHALLNSAQGKSVALDINKLLSAADQTQNLVLSLGDTIIVPSREAIKGRISVLVAGQVSRPGVAEVPAGARVTDAITMCGGVTPTAALKAATLRRGAETISLDLDAILRKGDAAADLPLQDGDSLLLPQAHNEVTLIGEFTKPGTYTFKEGDCVTDAIALAGGTREATADLSRAVLKRGGKDTPIDLAALLRMGDMRDNLPLQDGDTIVLPMGTRVYVSGAMAKPGVVTVKQGAKLMDVFLQAGGQGPKANLEEATVLRLVEGEDQPKVFKLNIRKALEKGTADRNFTFADGDVLYVPEKGKGFSFSTAANALYWLTIAGLNPLRMLRR